MSKLGEMACKVMGLRKVNETISAELRTSEDLFELELRRKCGAYDKICKEVDERSKPCQLYNTYSCVERCNYERAKGFLKDWLTKNPKFLED